MKKPLILVAVALMAGIGVRAQRPSDPALLVPQTAPSLDYVAVPNPVTPPPGVTMGASASVAFTPSGNIVVLTRGAEAFFEFDPGGRFIRSFGGSMFTRAHGVKIDPGSNIWATDVGGHTVVKLDRDGKVLLTLGEKGQAGEWNDATGSRRLNQPTDVAFGDNGDVFVSQGHTPGAGGDARVLKFDRDGRFLTSWGGKGTEPGKFQVAHGLAIDGRGQVWVMDRENQRIQVFTQQGAFVRQMKFAGLPCSTTIGPNDAFMVNGFAGQLVRLDLDGNVLGVIGKPGEGLGEFGEAHILARSPAGEIFVADSVNGALQKFVKR